MAMANKFDFSGGVTTVKSVADKCRWCRSLCGDAGCRLKDVKFVRMNTKKRSNCGRCVIPIECKMPIYWHPSQSYLALHQECGDQEGLQWEYPDPTLANPNAVLQC